MTRSPRVARRALRTAGLMALFGVILGWVSIVAVIPLAERLGLSAKSAHDIPFLGFALGLALGRSVAWSATTREAVTAVAAPFLVGAVGWFFGLLAGAVLMVFGLPTELADPLPTVGFALGAIVGGVVLFAEAQEGWMALRRRWTGRR